MFCICSSCLPYFLLQETLESFCPSTAPRIPSLIVQCVQEIERRGLEEVNTWFIDHRAWGIFLYCPAHRISLLSSFHFFFCFSIQSIPLSFPFCPVNFLLSLHFPVIFLLSFLPPFLSDMRWSHIVCVCVCVCRRDCTVCQEESGRWRSCESGTLVLKVLCCCTEWMRFTWFVASWRTSWGNSESRSSPSHSTKPSWRQQVTFQHAHTFTPGFIQNFSWSLSDHF